MALVVGSNPTLCIMLTRLYCLTFETAKGPVEIRRSVSEQLLSVTQALEALPTRKLTLTPDEVIILLNSPEYQLSFASGMDPSDDISREELLKMFARLK